VTVAFSSIGTSASGSTTVAPSYPASIASGDYLTCVVTSGATSSETPTTPTGWTLLGTGASTDGAFGVDTGPRRVTVFGRIADGTESGTLTVSITNGNTCRGSIIRWTKSALFGWNVVGSGGNDSTSGTGFSAATGAIDWAVGDCTLVAVGQRVDTATQSAQSLTATGITFGTRTNQRSDADTTGNDHRHVIDTFAATTGGTGSQAPTWAYTASTSVSGGLVIVRLREVANSPIAGRATGTGTGSNATPKASGNATPTVASATGTSWVPASGRRAGAATAVGVANNVRMTGTPIHLAYGSDGTPTQTFTTGAFSPPANSRIIVIGRATRNNHLSSFTNWAATDSASLTWTKLYTAAIWPNDSSAFARNVVMFSAPVGGSPPGSMTVTLDAWNTADTGWYAAAVIVLRPEQFNPNDLIGIGPAASADTVSVNETAVTLGSATGNVTYAVFFSEDNGPNVTWATPPAGWTTKATAATGIYVGATVLRAESDADGTVQTSYTGSSAFQCAGIAFELNPWPYPAEPAVATGTAHNAGVGRYQTTADLVAAVLQPSGQVVAWMPNTEAATSKTDAAWEQGQFSSFTNTDTSPSYGHWYPNTTPAGPPYVVADYNLVASIPLAFSGNGYLEHILTSAYADSYATQQWRTLDQAGNNLPATATYSWRFKLHEEITYDNGTSPDNGWVQHFQLYRLQPSNAVLVGMGAGLRNGFDNSMRWYVDLKDRANWDIAHVNSPPIPIGGWVHMEVQVLITDQASGYLRVYQDGVIVIDYSGPTVANAWTTLGCSWGMYGHLLTLGDPSVVHVDYDELLISTVGTFQQLLLPSAPGGMGDPARPGVASATGTASNATVTTSGNATNAPAGLASSTGTGQAATTKSSGNTITGLASATGTGANATTTSSGNTVTGVAQGTGTGQGATSKVGPVVQLAPGTGTGANPTTTASGNTITGLASASGTGTNATVVTGALAQAQLASATGTGQGATTKASGNTITGLASGTGTGSAASGGIGGGVGPAAGTGTSTNATTKASGNTVTEVAQGTGTAQGATVSTSSAANAPAQVASATGTARDVVGRFIPAGAATGAGSAADATVSVRVAVLLATGTGTAQASTVVTGTLAAAGPAASTGTGQGATTKASGNADAGLAQATGTATDPGVSGRTQAGAGSGTGAAPAPSVTKAVAAQAGTATANGTGYAATVLLARIAQAETALALALAHGAVAYTVAPGLANAGGATARAAAYGVARRPEFIGGAPVLLEPVTLTVITPAPGPNDGFGNATWDYGVGAARRDIVGWVQQDRRAEGFHPGRDPLEEHWLLVTNDLTLTGRDRVQWLTYPAGPITFEIEGPPEPAYRPGTGFHHTEATMRRLVG
jgi:hypothetical protein